jgi:hypothetical protein
VVGEEPSRRAADAGGSSGDDRDRHYADWRAPAPARSAGRTCSP